MPEVTEKCPTCANSIFCPTWAEWKCLKLKKRVYDKNERENCQYYQKRSKGAEEPQCHCEDCLKQGKDLEE